MGTCGAKTRAGTPCKQKAIYSNGRCKFHGGLATGPTTEAGKAHCRINGQKGGRPRKDGATAADAQVSARVSSLRETIGHKVRDNASWLLSDTKVSQRVSDSQSPASSAAKTEVMEHEKTRVSVALPGKDSVRVVTTELQDHVQPESKQAKPKSWMLKVVKVQSRCEHCTMFASNGSCLAVAKGVIPSIPTGENCPAFSAF